MKNFSQFILATIIIAFSNISLAEFNINDEVIYNATLRSCEGVTVGANSFFKRAGAALNRWGYEKKHHNTDPETYVWINNAAAIRENMSQAFFNLKFDSNDQINSMLDSPGYWKALEECFPSSKYPKHKEIKVNFSKELMAQIVTGKLIVGAGEVMMGMGSGLALKGARIAGRKAYVKGMRAMSPRGRAATRELARSYKGVFPEGAYPVVTGAITAAGIVTTVGAVSAALYRLYVTGPELFKKTLAAVRSHGSSEEIVNAFSEEANRALDDQLEGAGLSNNDIHKSLTHMINRLEGALASGQLTGEKRQQALVHLEELQMIQMSYQNILDPENTEVVADQVLEGVNKASQ